MTTPDYIDFLKLSFNAKLLFIRIEEILFRYQKEEMHITKEDLAWECNWSTPKVKTFLRELKQAGYIESKNPNSPIIRIGKKYKYREKHED